MNAAAQTVTGTYAAQFAQVGGDCILTVHVLDENNSLLSGAIVTLNGTAYQALSGQFGISGITSGDHYVGSVTWENVVVNASVAVTVSGNQTYAINCNAWPYTIGGAVNHASRPIGQ